MKSDPDGRFCKDYRYSIPAEVRDDLKPKSTGLFACSFNTVFMTFSIAVARWILVSDEVFRAGQGNDYMYFSLFKQDLWFGKVQVEHSTSKTRPVPLCRISIQTGALLRHELSLPPYFPLLSVLHRNSSAP